MMNESTSSTMLQVSVTDLTRQVLESSRDMQARHDKQFEMILMSLNPRFDRLDSAIRKVEKDLGNVEKDLGAKISNVEKEVTFIRATGIVIVVLLTLAIKIPSRAWEKLFSIEP